MLFTDEEINRLALFPNIAKIVNTLYEIAQRAPLNVTSINNHDFTNIEFFNNFKSFVFEFDSFLIRRNPNLKYSKRIIGQFELSLKKDNFIAGINDNAIFFKFVVKLKVFIDAIFDFIKVDIKDFDILLNNEPNLSYFYSLLNKVMTFNNLSSDNIYFEDKIKVLEDRVNGFLKNYEEQNELLRKESKLIFRQECEIMFRETTKSYEEFRTKISDLQNRYTSSLEVDLNNLSLSVENANRDFEATYKDYEILKKLVNAKGEQNITDHYDKKANQEKKIYWSATITTIAIIILSISLAMCGLSEYNEKTNIPTSTLIEKYKDQSAEKIEKIYAIAQKNALIYLVLRLIISLLIFSSIIYTSRVAYRAYVHMRHSENMMLKLATLRPFINQLEEEDRNQIHKDLIPDYFGKDAGMVDSTNEKFKDLPANVSAVAMKAIEQISGSGSNSSTEKNNKKPESETG